ncbi:uncharacterized protein LOC141858331 [Brevipalpus obovatus]|uniref:uncharacterized protein LOC141858331 n=1 Tax=Brevipalpus obovatus TaxID=246614 RepID=UPI003D9F7FFA
MANPRKFSEKIAIQKQKQAEETAAFEQIMRDVIKATRISGPGPINRNQLHINVGNCRAESLPDVNLIGQATESSIDLKAALNNLDEIRRGREPARRHPSPGATSRSPQHLSGGHHRSSFNDHRRNAPSPYSSPVYLSPPPMDWRRTNSDSAINQTGLFSLEVNQGSHLQSGSSSPRRSTVHDIVDNNSVFVTSPNDTPNTYSPMMPSMAWDPGKDHLSSTNANTLLSVSLPNDSRPKSCEVPGITIHPSPDYDNGTIHHLNSFSNTGSLPDLTNLHFPAPLAIPIDVDDPSMGLPCKSENDILDQGPCSPYSVSSPGGSPSSYLPCFIPSNLNTIGANGGTKRQADPNHSVFRPHATLSSTGTYLGHDATAAFSSNSSEDGQLVGDMKNSNISFVNNSQQSRAAPPPLRKSSPDPQFSNMAPSSFSSDLRHYKQLNGPHIINSSINTNDKLNQNCDGKSLEISPGMENLGGLSGNAGTGAFNRYIHVNDQTHQPQNYTDGGVPTNSNQVTNISSPSENNHSLLNQENGDMCWNELLNDADLELISSANFSSQLTPSSNPTDSGTGSETGDDFNGRAVNIISNRNDMGNLASSHGSITGQVTGQGFTDGACFHRNDPHLGSVNVSTMSGDTVLNSATVTNSNTTTSGLDSISTMQAVDSCLNQNSSHINNSGDWWTPFAGLNQALEEQTLISQDMAALNSLNAGHPDLVGSTYITGVSTNGDNKNNNGIGSHHMVGTSSMSINNISSTAPTLSCTPPSISSSSSISIGPADCVQIENLLESKTESEPGSFDNHSSLQPWL